MKAIWRRSLSLLLVFVMIVSMMPTSALALDLDNATATDNTAAAEDVTVTATPEPTAEPTPEPTPEATDAPEVTETPEPTEAPEEETGAQDETAALVAEVEARVAALPTEITSDEQAEAVEAELAAIDEIVESDAYPADAYQALDWARISAAYDALDVWYSTDHSQEIYYEASWADGTTYLDLLNGEIDAATLYSMISANSSVFGTASPAAVTTTLGVSTGGYKLSGPSTYYIGSSGSTYSGPTLAAGEYTSSFYRKGTYISRYEERGSFTVRHYYAPTVTISGVADKTGTVTPSASGATKIYAGTNNAVVTVPHEDGYTVTAIYNGSGVNMTQNGDNWTGTFTAVNSDAVAVTYTEVSTTGTVNLTVSGSGTVAFNGTDQTAGKLTLEADEYAIVATPAEGWYISAFSVNSADVTTYDPDRTMSGSLTVEAGSEYTVSATFAQQMVVDGDLKVKWNPVKSANGDTTVDGKTLDERIVDALIAEGSIPANDLYADEAVTVTYMSYEALTSLAQDQWNSTDYVPGDYDVNHAFGNDFVSEETTENVKVVFAGNSIYDGMEITKTITLVEARPELALTDATYGSTVFIDDIADTDDLNSIYAAAMEALQDEPDATPSYSYKVDGTLNNTSATDVKVSISYAATADYVDETAAVVTVPVQLNVKPSTITTVVADSSTGSGAITITDAAGTEVSSATASKLTVTVDPTDDGSYVESVTVTDKNGDAVAVSGDYSSTVYTGTFEIGNENAYTVTVTYGKLTVSANDYSVLVNGYSNETAQADFSSKVTVDAIGATNSANAAGTYVIQLNGAIGWRDIDNLNYIISNYLDVDTTREMKVVFTPTDTAKYPAAVSDTVTLTITEARGKAVITLEDEDYKFTAVDYDTFVKDVTAAVKIADGNGADISAKTEDETSIKSVAITPANTFPSEANGTQEYTVTVNTAFDGETWTDAAETTFTVTGAVTTWTITWDLNGGTQAESDTTPLTQYYLTGAAISLGDAPTLETWEGYTHKGWLGWDETSTTVTANAIYQAIWEANEYTIIFDENGGTAVENDVKGIYGNKISAPAADPERTGHTFVGWSTVKDNANTKVDFDVYTVPVDGDTLYALWTANPYSYSIETYTMDTTGKYGDPVVETETAKYGTEVSVTPEAKEGFTVDTDESVLEDTVVVPVEGKGTTLKVYYIRNQYNVIYMDGEEQLAKDTYYYEASVTEHDFDAEAEGIQKPGKTGYTFTAWDGTIPTTMPAKDVTVKAQWDAIEYTITWNAGEGVFADGSKIITEQVAYGEVPVAPETPSKTTDIIDEYKFTVWNPTIATVTEDIEYTAQYEKAEFVAKIGNVGYTTWAAAYAAANSGDTITLLDNIALAGKFTIAKAITVDGQGKYGFVADTENYTWYTTGGLFKKYNTHLIGINCSNVTMSGVTFECANNAAGVNLYQAQNVTFINVSILNAKNSSGSALTVNGSTLTVKGTLTAASIDVSQGEGVTSTLGIVAAEGAKFISSTITIASAAYPNTDMDEALNANNESFFGFKLVDAEGNLAGYFTKVVSNLSGNIGNGYTIEMLRDVTQTTSDTSTTLLGETTATLDMNGYKLTSATNKPLVVNGNLTIVDMGEVAGSLVLGKTAATITGPADLTVTTTVANCKAIYVDGVYKVGATVTWIVDGTETTEDYVYGAMPSFKGSTAKDPDEEYTYTFNGWDKELVAVEAPVTYTAQYSTTANTYTIRFLDEAGNVLDTQELAYGATPVYAGETVIEKDYYTASWSPAIEPVTKAADYTLSYTINTDKNFNEVPDEMETLSVTIVGGDYGTVTVNDSIVADGAKVLYDSRVKANIEVVATPDSDNGYFVETLKLGGYEAGTYNGYVKSASSTNATTLNVTFTKSTVGATNGTIAFNKYLAAQGSKTILASMRTDILKTAGLEVSDIYTVRTEGTYTILGKEISVYVTITDGGATYYSNDPEVNATLSGVDASGYVVQILGNDKGRNFTIDKAASGHIPAATQDNVYITFNDTRTKSVTVTYGGERLVVDEIPTADTVKAGFVYEVDGTAVTNCGAATATLIDGQSLPAEGADGVIKYNVSVAENEHYLKTETMVVEVPVANKAHLTTLAVNASENYTVTIQDGEGNDVVGQAVASGSYYATVTPKSAEGYYVDSDVSLDGFEGSNNEKWSDDCVYTIELVVENHETEDQTATLTVKDHQRCIVAQPLNDDETAYHVTLLDEIDKLDELKAAIYAKVVDAAKSSHAPDAATNYYVVDGVTAVKEGSFTVTITYPAGKTDSGVTYPAVSLKDVAVNVSKDKADVTIPRMDALTLEVSIGEGADAVKAAFLNANTALSESDVTVTLQADETAVLQGGEDSYTYNVSIKETKTTREYDGTFELEVKGKVWDAEVDITIEGKGGAEYSTGTELLTMTPAEDYFVDTISVSTNGGEAVVEELDEDEVCTFELANGEGKELGYKPVYAVTVLFSQPSITIPGTATMTYYHGMTNPDGTPVDRNELVIQALKKDGGQIVYNPADMDESETKIEYLARANTTVPTQVNLNLAGGLIKINETVNVPVGEMWLSIGQDIPEADPPTQEQLEAIAEEILADYDYNVQKLMALGKDGLLALLQDTLVEHPELQDYYDYFGAHQYGTQSTETIHLVNGEVVSNYSVLTLTDDRETTSISLVADKHLTYGFTEDELLAAIVEGVYASESGKIGGAADVTLVTPIDSLNASENALTVEVKYAGVPLKYQPSTATTTIYVDRAPVDVMVDNRLIKWEEGLTYDLPVSTNPEGVATVNFIVGLDISDVNFEGTRIQGIMGNVQLLLPEEMQFLVSMVDSYLGTSLADGGSITISKLQEALNNVGGLFDGSEYEEWVNVLTNALNSLPTDVADVELTIGGTMPTDIGVYLVGAISADSNYTTDFGVGFVVITPNGIKADIDWKQDDENYIITRTLLTTKGADGNYLFDTSAYATKLYEEGDIDFATEQILEIFAGVDIDGNILLETDQTKLNVGAYAEVAMIVNWGNEVYYSEPIARPIVVVAESLNVAFIDENGEENNERIFEFDNELQDGMEQVRVSYKYDGEGYKAGDEITDYSVKYLYVGVQTNGKPIAQFEAPVHAGAYTVTALVTLRDGSNGITHAGVAVGALAITPTESTMTVGNKTVVWDGDEHGVADMITATSTVPGLTPDSTIITAGLSADLDTINGLEDINGNINVDMPLWLDEVIQTLGIADAGYVDGIKPATFLAYIEKVKAAAESEELQTVLDKLAIEIDLSGLDKLAGIIEQLPENATLTFYDNVTYSEVGAYLVLGVVTDSDHYPSVGAGIMVIYPNATKVELRFEEDWNGNYIFTQGALLNMNLDAAAYDLGTENVNAEATAKVTNLYLGFNDNGEVVLTAERGAEASLDNGAYTQIAFLLDIGNEMYYAEPVARGFLIVPTPATVEFIDENGDENADRHFVFNNEAHEMAVRVTVNGTVVENPGEKLQVRYVGVQTNGELWNSDEAPVHAGSYVVTATYSERDSLDRVVTLGVAVGAMVIEPAETTTDVANVLHEYDGTAVSTEKMVTVSTDSGVNPDTTIITAAIKTDGTFSENLLKAIESEVNIDLPDWTDDILSQIGVEDGVTPADLLSAIEKAENKIIELAAKADVEVEEGFLDQLTAIVEQLPEDAVITFNDAPEYTEVGAYLVIGVVTDSDHYPSMDAGVLVIYPAVTGAELHWIYDDTNGVFTLDTLSVIDLGAYATVGGEKSEAVPFKVLYLGVNAETLEITLTNSQDDLDVGVYTEFAYVLDVDSNMYVAAPISRPVIIVPNAYDVKAEGIDVPYDRMPHGVEVTEVLNQFGENILDDGELTVTYMGVSSGLEGYMSEEAPVNAGLYKAVITFVTYDESGNVNGAGSKVVDVNIRYVDPDFDLLDNTVTYDGNDHFVVVDNDHLNVDYIGMIRTEDGINLISSEGLKDLVNALDEQTYMDATAVKEAIEKAIDAVEDLDIEPDAMEEFVNELMAIIEEINDGTIYKFTANGDNPVDAGTYNAYVVTLPTMNYSMDVSSGTLTIEPKAIEITVKDQQITYGETLPANGFTAEDGAVIGTDDLDLTYTYTDSEGNVVKAPVNVGTYTITAEADNDNYAVTVSNGTLEITKKAVTLTADDKSKVYGDTDPKLTAAVEGLVGEDTLNYSLAREDGENVGEYDITVTLGENPNYEVSATNGTFTINKAKVTVTADDVTVTYGAKEPVLTYQVDVTTGAIVDELKVSIYKEPTGGNVGTYTIYVEDAKGETNPNYDIEYVKGTYVISPAAVTVKANDASKVYGDADPAITYTVDGMMYGEKLTVTCGRVAGENVGTYAITPAVTADEISKNYSITIETGTLTITKKAATVTADDKSKVYGDTDPEFTSTITGLVAGDSLDVTYSREAGDNVGTYAITPSASSANYDITLVAGKLEITKKAITVTADDKSKVYGDADPEFTSTITGLVAGDSLDVTYSREAGDNVGTYAITPSASSANYDITLVAGKLEITKKAITVTADDKSKTYGDADPEFTSTITGLVAGDSLDVTYSREAGDNVGTYAITPSASSANYDITLVDGTLTIEAKEITAADVALDGTLTYNGTEQTQKVTVTDGITYEVTGNKQTNVGDSDYTLTVTGTGNYTGFVDLTWNIAPAEVTSVEVVGAYESNGSEQTVTLVVKAGDLTLAETDYTVNGNKATEPGDYTVTVTGTGNFTGTATADWTMVNQYAASITVDGSTTYYKTLQEAIKAVTDKGVIELLKNGEVGIAGKELTILRNGFEATVAALKGYYVDENDTAYLVKPLSAIENTYDGPALAYIDWNNDGFTADDYVQHLQEALYDAEESDKSTAETPLYVRLLTDFTSTNVDGDYSVYTVIIPGDVILDIESWTLEAKYVIGLNGSKLTATSIKSSNIDGKLIVDKDNLALAAIPAVQYDSKGNELDILPIYDKNLSCFRFARFRVLTDTDARKLTVTDDEIYFQFKSNSTTKVLDEYLSDGATNDELAVIVRVEWTAETGVAYQDFVYKDVHVGKVSTSNYDYTLTLTGYDVLGIDTKTLKVTGMIVADSGVVCYGQTWGINGIIN